MPQFISKYKVIEKIGEGSFSEVLKCENRISKEVHAAKILKKCFQNPSDVLYCAEIVAMQKLSRHPNVLYMLEYFFEKSSGRVAFIFELMDMSMYEFMKTKKRCIPEMKVKHYLYQMLNGTDYLHRHGLFHRDIKPENILVKIQTTNHSTLFHQNELVKLADLGSVRGIYSKPPYTEYISTRWYRSPECLLTVGHYGPKMDMWATGCVFYEILTMKPLFPGSNEIDQLSRIHAILGTPSTRLLSKLKSRSKNLKNFTKQIGTGLGPLINQFSEDAQTIIKLMLQYDPDIRSNARRLLQHRYFTVFREQERFEKYGKRTIAREYGDSVTLTYSSGSDLVKKSNSMKSVLGDYKKPSLLCSKTTIELPRRKLVQIPTEKLNKSSIKTNGMKVSTPRKTLPIKNKNSNVFRNTTSNLLQKIGLDGPKMNEFRSNSYVMAKQSYPKEKHYSIAQTKRTKL